MCLVEYHSRNISVKAWSKYLKWNSRQCQFSFFPIISQWQLKVAIANRVLIRLGQKQYYSFPLPIDAILYVKYGKNWLQRSCRLKMWTTDGRRMPDYTISSPTRTKIIAWFHTKSSCTLTELWSEFCFTAKPWQYVNYGQKIHTKMAKITARKLKKILLKILARKQSWKVKVY